MKSICKEKALDPCRRTSLVKNICVCAVLLSLLDEFLLKQYVIAEQFHLDVSAVLGHYLYIWTETKFGCVFQVSCFRGTMEQQNKKRRQTIKQTKLVNLHKV